MEDCVELQRFTLSLILGDHIHCQKALCFSFLLILFFVLVSPGLHELLKFLTALYCRKYVM